MNITDKDKRELEAAFRNSLERHDVREHHRDEIMRWLQGEMTTLGVLQNVFSGHMDVVGLAPDGGPAFQLTEKGFAHVQELKRRAK